MANYATYWTDVQSVIVQDPNWQGNTVTEPDFTATELEATSGTTIPPPSLVSSQLHGAISVTKASFICFMNYKKY